MNKKSLNIIIISLLALMLTGFKSTSEKAFSLAVVYCATALIAVVVFLIYIGGIRNKRPGFILLFSSIFVVNMGYFALAISKSLEEALLANRISYLGSVFLPLSMLIIIMEAVKAPCKKWFTGALTALGIIVFLVAASPGYLDIYYKEVDFAIIDGVAVLQKVYGPLHIVYLFYLLGYFSSMIGIIFYAIRKKRVSSSAQSVMLLASVFINIMVWLFEQLVKINFEILAVSYVITEMFLVGMCFMLQDNEKVSSADSEIVDFPPRDIPAEASAEAVCIDAVEDKGETVVDFYESEEYKVFVYGLGQLTNTEQKIYRYYTQGKSTQDILALLDITENTLKYHNKNIYGKLGVTSRKQLKEIAARIEI